MYHHGHGNSDFCVASLKSSNIVARCSVNHLRKTLGALDPAMQVPKIPQVPIPWRVGVDSWARWKMFIWPWSKILAALAEQIFADPQDENQPSCSWQGQTRSSVWWLNSHIVNQQLLVLNQLALICQLHMCFMLKPPFLITWLFNIPKTEPINTLIQYWCPGLFFRSLVKQNKTKNKTKNSWRHSSSMYLHSKPYCNLSSTLT